MANTTNIIPNKLTMYQRVEGGVWHYLEVLIKNCIRLSLQCKYNNLLFTIFYKLFMKRALTTI